MGGYFPGHPQPVVKEEPKPEAPKQDNTQAEQTTQKPPWKKRKK